MRDIVVGMRAIPIKKTVGCPDSMREWLTEECDATHFYKYFGWLTIAQFSASEVRLKGRLSEHGDGWRFKISDVLLIYPQEKREFL